MSHPLVGPISVVSRGIGTDSRPVREPLFVAGRGLSKVFFSGRSALRAVDSVDLSIKHGQSVGIVGESGSGKSTLGRLVMLLEQPTSGSLVIDGRNSAEIRGKELKAFRRRVQIVFQDPFSSLVPRLTAVANIAEPLMIHRLANKAECQERALGLLERVGIPRSAAALYPNQFSGGQQQRIAIARALSLDPELIVCDEPTSALDVSVQAQVLELLSDVQAERGLSLLVISHNLAVVEQLATEVLVMRRGRVLEQSSATDLFASPQHPYTQALMDAVLPLSGPPVSLEAAVSSVPPHSRDGALVEVAPGHWLREVLAADSGPDPDARFEHRRWRGFRRR